MWVRCSSSGAREEAGGSTGSREWLRDLVSPAHLVISALAVPGATEPTAGPHILPPEPAIQLRCSIKGKHFAFTQPFASQPAGIPSLKSKQHFTAQASCLKSCAVQ